MSGSHARGQDASASWPVGIGHTGGGHNVPTTVVCGLGPVFFLTWTDRSQRGDTPDPLCAEEVCLGPGVVTTSQA